MKLRVLGCSGGIGGARLRTTSLLVDHDILLDAGTGVGDLSIDELAAIDHVFLTHAHLDHIAALPLMVDTLADRRQTPLTVHAPQAVIDVLREHMFNWAIWPDFTEIPTPDAPVMRFQPLAPGETVVLGGRKIRPVPVDHTVPAVGYHLDSGQGSLVFSGDTGVCDAFWNTLNQIGNLRYLIVECAFPNREHRLAQASKHLYPEMLLSELQKLAVDCEILITHLKPSQIDVTMAEIEHYLGPWRPRMLEINQVVEF